MNLIFCQSCGMPLNSDADSGTKLSKDEAIAQMKEYFPKLKRWRA